MPVRHASWVLVACILPLSSCAECYVFFEDISPNSANGTSRPGSSEAGLTYELAGDESAFYAVSLNASLFKSVNHGPWEQLDSAPRYATTMAVDPTDGRHLAVGERNGDPVPSRLTLSGLWESTDAGVHWTFTFSPETQAGCRALGTQAVPAVLFSPATGTLFVGTPCGIGRRPKGAQGFDFTASPAGIGFVKAFAASYRATGRVVLWARADNGSTTRILSSVDDGATWTAAVVPARVDGYAIGAPNRGGDFSMAAYGETAVLDFRPMAGSDARLWDTNSSNFCTLLYYDRPTGGFRVQALTNTGDGTGLGGRKRLRTFLPKPERGGGQPAFPRVFYIAGQDVLQATSTGPDGFLNWSRVALTRYAGSPTQDDVHPDIWDVHFSSSSGTTRLATDGGVFERVNAKWITFNDGLHTHHVHTISAIDKGSYARLAYATTDNSEWFRDAAPFGSPITGWTTYSALGDASWTFTDAGGPAVAILVRHAQLSVLTDFGLGMPAGSGLGAGAGFSLDCRPNSQKTACTDFTTLSPRTFAIIQTPQSQAAAPLLDVVFLAPTPFYVQKNGTVVPATAGPLAGVTSQTGGPVLVRNRKFLAHPQGSTADYADWEVVARDVPRGANAVWVSNGHVNPVYFVTATDGMGVTRVFMRRTAQGPWAELTGIGAPVLLPATVFGPLFVDPFDFSRVFVLTADGIRVPTLTRGSELRGTTPFELDAVLTALVTNSGEYPLNLAFPGARSNDVVAGSQAGAFAKSVIGQVGFSRTERGLAVVASPVTGLYYQARPYGGWYSLSQYQPRPFTMASSVAVSGPQIYVGLEGRGVWRIVDWDRARLSCYYDHPAPTKPDEVARFLNAAQLPVSGIAVDAIVVRDGIPAYSTVTTDLGGRIVLPGSAAAAVHLRFQGNDDLEPCATSFLR